MGYFFIGLIIIIYSAKNQTIILFHFNTNCNCYWHYFQKNGWNPNFFWRHTLCCDDLFWDADVNHQFKLKKTAILALLFCFVIEFLQLYGAERILQSRTPTLRHYVLGQGFLWSALEFYAFGVVIAFWMDSNWINKN
ncbi:MAG: DUF2809 domain-containing protein [Chryseobacterium sp.]|nr:DUF2809 domain-containing protein [Chryseobacterium sp.]